MKKCFILSAFCNLFLIPTFAQSSMSSSEILQAMHKLNTLGSVLYIAAHPDDENTRLLTYLAKERKYRTAYLSITRGDGGQNLLGSEQGDLLGLLRTEELLAARRIDGAEQWFTRAIDFGYSKNPEETFRFWNKDSVLADVVYAIRKFRPDVIICRFPTTGEGGHGHHTASAMLAEEAFELAANPAKFPEQLQYVEVWQARRLFWNTYIFGSNNTTSSKQIKMDVGIYNPLLGKSYGEISADSRSCHKSQGFGAAMQRGSQLEYFKQLKGDTVAYDMFEGIENGWERIPGGSKARKMIAACIKNFDVEHPEKSIPALTELSGLFFSLSGGQDPWWLQQKADELSELILACAGIWMETTVSDYRITPGSDIEVNTKIVKRNPGLVVLRKLEYNGIFDTSFQIVLMQNKVVSFTRKIKAGDFPYSGPHWLHNKHGNGMHVIHSVPFRGKPSGPLPYFTSVDLNFKGTKTGDLGFTHGFTYKYTDPVKGEIYRPVEILPPATVTPGVNAMVFRNGEVKKVFFLVKSNADSIRGSLLLTSGKSCRVDIAQPDFDLKKKGDEIMIEASVRILDPEYEGLLHAGLLIAEKSYPYSIQRIEYDHIPARFVLNHASVKLLRFDLKTNGNKIGYIPGAGDEVQACLKEIGYEVQSLSDDMIKSTDLSVYDAIITGVRAYNTNDKLPLFHKQLMDYVSQGGRLIIQYNTNSRIGPLQNNIGPYKFTISRSRVTDEDAEVKFLNDTCSLLNLPNKISRADFKGWVQERGIYFATDLDSAYQTILAMHDYGEPDQTGSLIWAAFGKGYFVYTGLSFFRQLPAGVPGAYRLFANLLSMPVNKP